MKRLTPFLIFSVLIHLLFIVFVKTSNHQTIKLHREAIKVSIIEVKLSKKADKKLKKENDININGQVVSQPLNKNDEKPKNSKLLSERDSSTEKETIKHGNNMEKLGQNDDIKEDRKEIEKERLNSINLFPREVIDNTADEISKREKRSGLNREQGINDAINGIEEGEGTFLNTSAFKYAAFFNRIKESVLTQWHPWDEVRAYDPTGRKYLFMDRKTILRVILDKDGYVVSAMVYQASGADFLDNEAIAAFNRCEQFPNPPVGMIVSGQISFTFGFEVRPDRSLIRF